MIIVSSALGSISQDLSSSQLKTNIALLTCYEVSTGIDTRFNKFLDTGIDTGIINFFSYKRH